MFQLGLLCSRPKICKAIFGIEAWVFWIFCAYPPLKKRNHHHLKVVTSTSHTSMRCEAEAFLHARMVGRPSMGIWSKFWWWICPFPMPTHYWLGKTCWHCYESETSSEFLPLYIDCIYIHYTNYQNVIFFLGSFPLSGQNKMDRCWIRNSTAWRGLMPWIQYESINNCV